ncbi:MAG: hypothetical protein HKL88_09840 [Bacteroidia bacterium]|nr:hypothetical protein [Bacteroidia bacterium]
MRIRKYLVKTIIILAVGLAQTAMAQDSANKVVSTANTTQVTVSSGSPLDSVRAAQDKLNAIRDAQMSKERTVIYILTVLLILAIVAALMLYSRHKAVRNQLKKLEEKHKQ